MLTASLEVDVFKELCNVCSLKRNHICSVQIRKNIDAMKKKDEISRNPERRTDDSEPEGYPLYPPSEDIYAQFKEEQEIDPEDITRIKEPVSPLNDDLDIEEEEEDELDGIVELDVLIKGDDISEDLDIPGSELDDDQEEIGNEDEENNYYSIGGDNHHDLEEDDGIIEDES